MTRLAIHLAPELALPRRFLDIVPFWGVLGGLLLFIDGDAVAGSRWHPATLALTHVFTLGILANTLFGSLLQFLPTAGGAPLMRERLLGLPACALLNGGTLLLVAGFRASLPVLLPLGGAALFVAFTLLAVMTLPGLWSGSHRWFIRAGLAAGISAGLVTASLGVLLIGTLVGHWQLPHSVVTLTNIHAAWGIVGWLLLPTASVASVVMPMFQGTQPPSVFARLLWVIAAAGTLGMGTVVYCLSADGDLLRIGVSVCCAMFASGVLVLQYRSPHRRNPALREFWTTAASTVLVAAAAFAFGVDGTLVGVLMIVGALPLFTVGMQLQISVFLTWLDLLRRSGGGMRLPPVQRLLDETLQQRVLRAQQVAVALMASALFGRAPWLLRAAGFALVATFVLLGFAQHICRRRAGRFQFGATCPYES